MPRSVQISMGFPWPWINGGGDSDMAWVCFVACWGSSSGVMCHGSFPTAITRGMSITITAPTKLVNYPAGH